MLDDRPDGLAKGEGVRCLRHAARGYPVSRELDSALRGGSGVRSSALRVWSALRISSRSRVRTM
jgi:hypothetical protein